MDRQYKDRQDQDQDQSQAAWDQDQDGYDDQEDQGMQAARQNIGRQGGDPTRGDYRPGRQGQQGQDAYAQDQDRPQGGYQDQSQRGSGQDQSQRGSGQDKAQGNWDTEDEGGYED